MKIWEWLGETRNQQILGFIGTALVAIGAALAQFGIFEPKKTPASPSSAQTAPVHPASAVPSTATTSGEDPAVQALLNALVRKEKSDKAEQEYRQEKEAWDIAQKLNTETAYQAYLSEYPKGHYARFASAAIDKLRSPIGTIQPAMNTVASNVAALPPSTIKHPKKHPKLPHKTSPAGDGHLVIQCIEGTKLYVDGKEKGRITTNLFGSFTATVPSGKHAVLLVSSQGVLQQNIDLKIGQSLRITPPFCN